MLVLNGVLFGHISIVHAFQTITNSPALTNSEQNFQSLVKLVEQKDFNTAETFYDQQKGAFAQDQRNAIFLFAAKALVITNDSKSHLGKMDRSDLYFLNQLATGYDYLTVQDGVIYRDCGITSSEAIPHLIEALTVVENEDPRFIDGDSKIVIEILTRLTRRDAGYVNGNDHFFATNHQAVTDWWQDWWKQNKNRRPVFDAELEKILRNEIVKIDEKIKQAKPTPNIRWDSSTRFELEHRGDLYSGNEWNGGPKSSVFTFYYGHPLGMIPAYEDYAPERIDDVLCIRGEFLTKSLSSKREPTHATTLSGKKFPMQEIFSKTVEGTDIAIKVQIVTTNAALAKVLCDRLNK